MGDFNLHSFLVSMFVLVLSLTVHEFAHAKAAHLAGDDTARIAGRLSLNPLAHLDPLGTIMMVVSSIAGFGIGWAKPVPVNPMNFRHPRWDNFRISVWGPLSNLLIAFVAGQIIRFGGSRLSGVDADIVFMFVIINLALAIFNLIPIAPLDGSHIMSSLLPVEKARSYDMFMGRFGFMLLLGLVFVAPNALDLILIPPVKILFKLLTGIRY